MITLIVTVILGLGFAYFATQNTSSISIFFGRYSIPNAPLYLVTLVPLLIGILVAFLIYITRDLSARLTEGEMQDELKRLKTENSELTKEVHKLELENTKLKASNGDEFDENSIQQ
ncbi:hypothetical protein A3A76_00615 [Candidatus Woesebacteria bacterium RIFCSPLOWO2_01_FULL_39_23]|uniref:Lipopolysaccharide assembly protein A domain-containing protein n=1 Tax=Candidatus Woesebacteria bacterium RIFCSPHIGHO2_01_FULL_40_22 TaxID=1802499 RepID=A0A1F7YIU9_9BACT|nr:MAG: hypothetical protein A2141_05765 [Candidatus Woesebacteria bacterium RBG_16_40_11]OGM27197.1 MAG: hypothetical protein A2628_04135 [Candidatus Woesebacteria bacterium RIFCSPHIGHO2_01_FULL_40_22]OGM63362.1 MAG: hypothetical protein A3A76_00615 [Candidatus Woesebacteria bacterium RIFCSPLOWO2_01_FULL_39_23]